ncbi:MAG TPA: response regulator transcription factor [Actinomycetales bacterium]|nr:response regulator transcription factor [Actinomycetales bacterium]
MNEKAHLLVVDDETNIRDLLAAALRFAGFEVTTAKNGNEALDAARDVRPDLIVLDVMMPDMDGFTVTRRLRARGDDMPVLFLTARADSSDAVKGLSAGGDDYVTKPFSLDEVVARIQAILRRSAPVQETSVLRTGPIELDEDSHEVRRAGATIDLSPTEFTLLRYLMINAGRVVSKQQILDHVWEYDFAGEGAIVESYISYLRRKLDEPNSPSCIITKRGVGYMLRTDWDEP